MSSIALDITDETAHDAGEAPPAAIEVPPTAGEAPPAAGVLLRMGANGEATALAAAITKWAVVDKAVALPAIGAIPILGSRAGKGALDELVGNAACLPSLMEAVKMHADNGLLTLGGLCALGALSTGGGDAKWKESVAGCARCHMLVEEGALGLSVKAMLDAGFDGFGKAWDIQNASLHVIASCCFGHDGKRGYGKPREAAVRRQTASKAGAIDAIVEVMRASVDRDPPKPADTRRTLVLAHRALVRVCMGFDKAGAARRERAVAADCIPVYVAALDAFFSSELFQSTIESNQLLMYEGGAQRADPFLDGVWQHEVEKRPMLASRVREEMLKKVRSDPRAVDRIRAGAMSDVGLQNEATKIQRAARKPPEAELAPGQYKDEEERRHFAREAQKLRDSAPARADEPSTWEELTQDPSFKGEMRDIKSQDDCSAYIAYLQKKNPRRLALLMEPDNMRRLNELLNKQLHLRGTHS